MESEAHNAISKALSEAGTVLFFGYGFITQNDKFLYENGPLFADRAFATTFHMVDEKEEEIESRLGHGCLKSKSAGSQIHQFIKPNLRNETCAALVDRFSYVFEKMGRE